MAGCSTSGLVKQWSDPSYHGPALTKILIVAIRKDPTKRRVWEDAFSSGLAKLGVNATQSYRLFPDATPDSSHLAEAMADKNFDGIIITRWLPKERIAEYVAPSVTTEPETRYSARKQEFVTFYREIENPGYVDTQEIANRSIDVWIAGSDSRLIWSAVSETPEPATSEAVHRDIVGLVTSDLTKGALSRRANRQGQLI